MAKDIDNPDQMSREALANLLHDDVQHYDSLVRDHLSRIYQLLLVVFTVAGIAGTLLYGYHQYAVLLAIPLVGCIVLFIGANLTGEMFALAAHKYFLEQNLAKVLVDAVPASLRQLVPPPWDSAGGRIRRRSFSYIAIQASYILTLIIVSAIAIAIAWMKLGHYWWLAPVICALTVVLAAAALLSYVEAVLAFGDTLDALAQRIRPKASLGRRRHSWRRVIALLKGGGEEDWGSWQVWQATGPVEGAEEAAPGSPSL
jgi:hypothetical protein